MCYQFKHLHSRGRRCSPETTISAILEHGVYPQTRSMTPVNIQRSATNRPSQQAAFVLLQAHAAVTCTWQLEGGDSENSAGRPTSKEGRSFILDLVLEEFAGCALPVASPHFHLKTHNMRPRRCKRSVISSHSGEARNRQRRAPVHVCPCRSQWGDPVHGERGCTGGSDPSQDSPDLRRRPHPPVLRHHSGSASPRYPGDARGKSDLIFPDDTQNQDVKASFCRGVTLSPSALSRRQLDSSG